MPSQKRRDCELSERTGAFIQPQSRDNPTEKGLIENYGIFQASLAQSSILEGKTVTKPLLPVDVTDMFSRYNCNTYGLQHISEAQLLTPDGREMATERVKWP